MPTYKNLQDWVRTHFGFTPKTCWIADVKASSGIPIRKARNRHDPLRRAHPCPENRRRAILQGFRHFGAIK